jgi:hypothetical protein
MSVTVTSLAVTGSNQVTWSFSSTATSGGTASAYKYNGSGGYGSATVSGGKIVINYFSAVAAGQAWAITSQPGANFSNGQQILVPQSGIQGASAAPMVSVGSGFQLSSLVAFLRGWI